MDNAKLLETEVMLLSLAVRGKDGDAEAVSELYHFAQSMLIQEHKRNQKRGRKPDNTKKHEIMLWAVSAAREQLAGFGSIDSKKLTADTLLLAQTHGKYYPERTTREVIKRNIRIITNIASI